MGRATRLHGKASLCLERALIPLLFVLSPSRPWTHSPQSWECFPCPAPAFRVLLLQGSHFLSMSHSATHFQIYSYTFMSTSVSPVSVYLVLIFKLRIMELLRLEKNFKIIESNQVQASHVLAANPILQEILQLKKARLWLKQAPGDPPGQPRREHNSCHHHWQGQSHPSLSLRTAVSRRWQGSGVPLPLQCFPSPV